MNTHREAQRLDYNPTQHGVDQLALLLISDELEWSSLHAPGSDSPAKPPKISRIRRLDGGEDKGKGPGKGKGKAKDGGKDSPKSEDSPTKSQKLCNLFGKGESGCTYGSKCLFTHDSEWARKEQLCFHCGMPGHMAFSCPSEAKPCKDQESERTSPKAKAKGKASARKVQGQVEGESEGTSPLSPANEVLAAATKALQNLSLKALTGPAGPVGQAGLLPELPEISLRTASNVATRGLLDGGATHALRQALPGKWEFRAGGC